MTAIIQGQIFHAGPMRPVTSACIGTKKQLSCGKHQKRVSAKVSRIVSIGRTRLGGLFQDHPVLSKCDASSL
jgi:hypothetical protein